MKKITRGDIFLGNRIKYIARVILNSEDYADGNTLVMSSTLVIAFDELLIELLTRQGGVYYKEILSKDEVFLDFELEGDESVDISLIAEVKLSDIKGCVISEVSMMWKTIENYFDQEFLFMILFWSNTKKLILALFMEVDDIKLLSFDDALDYLGRMAVSSGVVRTEEFKI